MFWIISDFVVNLVAVFLPYSLSIEIERLHEGCIDVYAYNSANGEPSPVPPRSVRGQKRAADGSLITRNVWEALIRFERSRLMTVSQERSATETASFQLDVLVSLHFDNVYEGGADRVATPAE